MFYSQDILQRRGGKFGIIWVAATKATTLSKRDYASVCVHKTCEDLIRYITLQVDALRPGASRPRFSLYLSSQLMYGVVCVYEKQQYYLFSDATTLSSSFRIFNIPTLDIDMRDPIRPEQVNVPDIVSTFRRSGDFPVTDPSFGLFKTMDLDEWTHIPDVEYWTPPSPAMDLMPDFKQADITFPESPKTPKVSFRPVFGSPLQAHPDTITLQEDPPVQTELPPLLGEQDLPPMRQEDLDHIDQPRDREAAEAQPRLEDLEAVQSPMARVALQGTVLQTVEAEVSAELDNLEAQLDRGRLGVAEETPLIFPEIDTTLLPPDIEQPRVPSPKMTPVTPRPGEEPRQGKDAGQFEMELTAVLPPTSGRRKRRQLLFCDAEMQLSRKQIRANMDKRFDTCNEFEPCAMPAPSVKDLFCQPGKKEFRHRRLLHLWSRNAISRDFQETDSDKMKPAWSVPELMLGDHSSSGSGSVKGSPMDYLQGTIGEPPLSPVLDFPEGQRAAMDSRLESTMEGVRGLDQSGAAADRSRMTSHHSLLSEAGREQDSLLSQHRDSSLVRDTDPSRLSAQRPGSADLSAEDITLHAEAPDFQAPEGLETLHELPEDQHLSPPPAVAPPRSQIRRQRETTGEESPTKRRRTSHREQAAELEEKMQSATHRKVLGLFEGLTVGSPSTTFRHICPYTIYRHQACHLFTVLLDFAAVKKLEVYQSGPYEDIHISRGEQY